MPATVFRNGTLFDGHRYAGPGELLVRDGLVAAVATGGEHLEATQGAQEVDLAGGLLAPGFVDAHVHAVQGGLERTRCDLSGLATREEYLAEVRRYADAHPERPWILGGGWAMAAFPGGTPLAADLDAVVPDRPLLLPNRDHHGAWVNTRALELAGITRHTPDPPHGHLERDADGHPTGTLHEGAMELVSRLLPAVTEAELDAGLAAGQAYLHACGITGWQDAIIGAYAGMDDPGPTYRRAAERGTLTGHVVGALWWDRGRGAEQLPDLVARRQDYTLGRFRATSVKIMQDGVAENGTAALGAPYLDRCGHATGNTGHSFLPPAALAEAVAALSQARFQVHVHAIGDRGVRETLDAFEAAGPDMRDLRHHVAHLQLVHPDDLARFATLGVAANIQALWACLDEQMVDLTLPFLGPERATWQYPFGGLHRAGARLVAGSDWPVSTPDPLAALHVAVNRRAHDEPGRAGAEPFLPEQALDLTTAMAAATSGSAWVNHRDDAGVLRPGAVGDLVVLDRDPFTGRADEIGATGVASTWVEGRPVHQA
ncbi:N-substituted formamide deformylase precursor [Nocardioides dokdonensis FR1436]|uniref:N-substituted formamide deformylase n=1 Tax=Nocardioides dokdonensis FR1436 TaxID=1300347 RepID=A0A1A9GMV8_9ACTN|nr:amidohydrolase [Nocardioides dokdonensis]ANH39002.1 N-substituted formamide deformylase precursor [Nocardioides dokdonensis FR1436]